MNQKKPTLVVTAAVLCLIAAAAITFGVPPRTVSAQAGSLFTMAAAFSGFGAISGVVIVDQSTGAVSVCTSQVFIVPHSATSNDACELRGRAIPGSGTSSLTVSGANGSVFILNNQSGQLLECTTFGNVRCISHGEAPR
jgi:hypothetical protein